MQLAVWKRVKNVRFEPRKLMGCIYGKIKRITNTDLPPVVSPPFKFIHADRREGAGLWGIAQGSDGGDESRRASEPGRVAHSKRVAMGAQEP